MKVCGIIAEYDPFHKGHLYQLEQARKLSQADYMVCVLGCAFSQRGDAMLFGTKDRALMALINGFDLVLGMPFSFSCAQANRFAAGGIGILNSLGVITHLSFGCESDQLDQLQATARLLNHPEISFIRRLKDELAGGCSFAHAQGRALQSALPEIPAALFSSPNFILGVSYLRELERLHSRIIPVPVLRQTAYHSREIKPLASASAVRALLLQDQQADLNFVCPPGSVKTIQQAVVHRPDALDKALLISLLGQPASALELLPEISEGLEARIKSAARKAASRTELIRMVKTKRYPYARISRALTHAMVGLHYYPETPGYARLLGFRSRARPLLHAVSRHGFPLVVRPARSALPEITQDMHAEELWQVGSGQGAQKAWQQQIIEFKNEEA
jgi:predicted nucleotidyltransferase